jgi:hypothetical protein
MAPLHPSVVQGHVVIGRVVRDGENRRREDGSGVSESGLYLAIPKLKK